MSLHVCSPGEESTRQSVPVRVNGGYQRGFPKLEVRTRDTSPGKGGGAPRSLRSFCVPGPCYPLILRGSWEVTAAPSLCRGESGGAGRDSGHSQFGMEPTRSPGVGSSEPGCSPRHVVGSRGEAVSGGCSCPWGISCWRAPQHPYSCPSRAPQNCRGSTHMATTLALPTPGLLRLVTCQEGETDLCPGHSQSVAWGTQFTLHHGHL